MNQGALHFDALLSVNNFDAGIARIKSGIRDASGVAKREAESMDSAFRNLGTAIGGYFTAQSLFSFTKELINVRGEFQKTEIAFSTMLGSADKAKVLMADMVTLAANTPFSLQDVSKGAKQLLAFQVPAKSLLETLTRIGNISAGVSVPIDRIILAYGQVKAAGRLMGTEMRQFTEAGIPMYAELAKVLKVDETAIKGMVEAGKVGFKEVEQVIKNLTNEGGMFFELMEKQSKSMSGRVSNLGDQWDQMLNKIGQANEGILYDGIEGLTHLVEHYQELFEMIKTLVISYGAYKAAIMVTSAAQSVANKTLATEIGLLSFSERMKLGRAIVTQRQTAATLAETIAEKSSLSAKYATLQAEVAILAVKKQKAVALGIERAQTLGNAQVQLASAQAELRSVQANGTAREVLIATKNVEKAQNTVIAAQESASIARTAALAAGTKFYAVQKELQVTATALSGAATTVETAAEVANAAAKSANAIATQRLTIAQLAQTVAMTAAARAAAFLNATLFANPYALAAALIAALAYSIYKYNTALTVAEESQKRMNDDAVNQIATLTEQEAKIKALIKVVEDQTSSEDTKAAAYKRIALLTNGRLDQLDAEAVKTGKATGMLQKYIEMLKLEAEAKRYVNELGRLETDTENLKNNRNNFGIGDMWDDFTDYDSSFQWSLKDRKKERVDRIVKDKEAEKKEIQKKLDDLAKRGVNITETEITEDKSPAAKGWAQKIKAQIDELEASADSAPTRAAYQKIRDKIKQLQELLNPKKEKSEGQLAEILPLGSIKELQQRASLISEAIDVAVNGQVKLRKLDKFGKDKDKKGNPYLTGETVSLEEAYKSREAIENKITSLQYKSFQERIDESERQWNNYYKISEFYGKETADAQYKDLFKGAKNYLEYLEKQEQALKNKAESGQILTEEDKKNIVFLQDKISDLNGTETPFENFKRGIDNALKSMPSLVDQLEYLEKAENDAFSKSGNNSNPFLAERKYFEDRKRDVLQQQKELYTSFIQEQKTFEDKKTEIEAKYNDFRKKIAEGKFSDSDRLKLLDAAGKAEAKEYGGAFLDTFKKTKLWEKIFGNMNSISKREVEKLIPILKAQIEKLISLDAPIDEIEKYKQKLQELENFTSGNSPIEKLVASFKKLTKQAKTADGKIDWRNFAKNYEEFADSLNAAVGSAFELGDALGFMSNTDGMQETINNLMETTKGLVNAIAGYASGDYAQMAGGIVQATIGLTKLLNGDDDKSFTIKSWERSINNLKTAYEQLNREVAKTAGSEQFDKQRELISNLEQQKAALQSILKLEKDKKKPDSTKVNEYENQINQLNGQIEDLVDGITSSIAGIGFKDLATQLSDALADAFGKGEDAALAYEKVVDDVMRNAVKNALKIAILEPATKSIVDNLIKSMGYGSGNNSAVQQQIKEAENLLNAYQKESSDIFSSGGSQFSYRFQELAILMKDLKAKIDLLKTQAITSQSNGVFDGLTKEERDKIKAEGQTAMQQYVDALQQYEDLFGAAAENAQGMKGDIKGVTEKTAGALEAQINAVRIMIAAIFKIHQLNQSTFKNQLLVQSQIEINTRPLKAILKEITELNSKVKKNLAGVP